MLAKYFFLGSDNLRILENGQIAAFKNNMENETDPILSVSPDSFKQHIRKIISGEKSKGLLHRHSLQEISGDLFCCADWNWIFTWEVETIGIPWIKLSNNQVWVRTIPPQSRSTVHIIFLSSD